MGAIRIVNAEDRWDFSGKEADEEIERLAQSNYENDFVFTCYPHWTDAHSETARVYREEAAKLIARGAE